MSQASLLVQEGSPIETRFLLQHSVANSRGSDIRDDYQFSFNINGNKESSKEEALELVRTKV